ncbi:MAG: hypothetical protein K6G24_09460 [Lachnospiraceae bacterium]|nr:hypothetical protein [Lachnospiraceae bacterium]
MDIKKNNVQVDNSEGIINEDNESVLENVSGGARIHDPAKNLNILCQNNNSLSPTQNPTALNKVPTQIIV